MKKPAAQPPAFSYSDAFIAHSENKAGGTANIAEHRASPLVVGVGNANEEIFDDQSPDDIRGRRGVARRSGICQRAGNRNWPRGAVRRTRRAFFRNADES